MASPTLKQMFFQAANAGQLFGNLSAFDASGRSASYDTHRASLESFAERLQTRMPVGLSAELTNQKLAEQNTGAEKSARLNSLILYGFGGLLALFICIRPLLLWDRERSRRKSMHLESPLGSPP